MGDSPTAITLRDLVRTAKAGGRFSCLTCYDATTARWLEKAGVEVLLVGDTAAEMILGHTSTVHAPLDFMVMITAAVKRGAPSRVVMADMPFMSYQADDAEALRNAGRFMTEGNADCVKIEADRTFAPLVEKMARAGIPVVAHVGSRPQQAKMKGGYVSTGRSAETALRVLHDAAALEAAGASMILVEACPAEVTQMVVERATVPVIGCGAGAACHGQVVVLNDLLGLTHWQPAFAKPLAAVGSEIERAAKLWRDRVRDGELGEHPYTIAPDELARLQQLAGHVS
jgi:3-methyl-2-oxobutanoate hydroxymethyltransferase